MTNDIKSRRKSLREVLPKEKFDQSASRFNNDRNGRSNGDNGGLGQGGRLAAKRRFVPKALLWSLAGLLVIFGAIAASTAFARIEIDLVPKQAVINLEDDQNWQAQSSPSTRELEFGTITDRLTETRQVEASGVESVSRQARGEVTIYNEYSQEAITLINQTRFADQEGREYRIQEAISLPGYTMEGGEKVPGELTVEVRADQPGEEYNIGPSDFVVPGLEGTQQYEEVYAKSSEPMSGGFVGEISQVDEEDQERVSKELEESLTEQARTGNQIDVPPGYVLFDDAIIFDFDSEVLTNQADPGQANIKGELAIKAVIFDENKLAEYLAREVVRDYDDRSITLKNANELGFNLVDYSPSFRQLENIEFNLSGQAHLIWLIDEDDLRSDLAGRPKSEANDIIEEYSIEQSRIRSTPFWLKTIPDNSDKIKVNIHLSESA